MLRFKIHKTKSTTQPWMFDIQDSGNNRILASSETYVHHSDVVHAVDLIRKGAAGGTVVDEDRAA